MQHRIRERLVAHQQAQLYRKRKLLTAAQHAHTSLSHQSVINFSSNDYLGLAAHPALIARVHAASTQWGVGAGASHLVSGHTAVHHELEQALATLTGRSRALLFSSGYSANLAVISSLVEREDTVLHDRLNHASLLDGTLLAQARFLRYQHNDMRSLQQRLQRAKGKCLIVSDGVFSMDGDVAPLTELAAIAAAHPATLMIDDAHGIGILGSKGGGCLEEAELTQHEVPILMGTLGKALGTSGAFVAGDDALIEYLIQFARPYIYTTAMPPALAAATLSSIELLEKEAWRRRTLNELISYFRQQAAQLGLALLPSRTPIQPLLIHDNARTMQIATQLLQQGFLVGAIRPPTVPSARLRITLSATHRSEEIDALLQAIVRLQS